MSAFRLATAVALVSVGLADAYRVHREGGDLYGFATGVFVGGAAMCLVIGGA